MSTSWCHPRSCLLTRRRRRRLPFGKTPRVAQSQLWVGIDQTASSLSLLFTIIPEKKIPETLPKLATLWLQLQPSSYSCHICFALTLFLSPQETGRTILAWFQRMVAAEFAWRKINFLAEEQEEGGRRRRLGKNKLILKAKVLCQSFNCKTELMHFPLLGQPLHGKS